MKKQLLKKLYSFIIPAISGAMLFSASTNAQIVYTDVNPDILQFCTATSLNSCFIGDSIDINNDGIFDLKLQGAAYAIVQQNPPSRRGYIRVSPLHGSAVNTDTAGKPLSMNLNDAIDAGGSWLTAASQILISSQSGGGIPLPSGNWLAGTDKYLGLKIVSGNQINYGWVQLNISSTPTASSFTIKDYAYNSTPNQPILAGQTVATGINENSFASSINLFPNPSTNHLTIELPKTNEKVTVTITDIIGKVIYSTTVSETQKLELNTKDFAVGVYLVQAQLTNFITTKKLIVEK
jgi:Secretion system C-terminal sorting domain